MGPAATTTTHPPVPRLAIIGSRPEASDTLAAPATPAGLRPVLHPPRPLTRIGSYRETGQTTAPGRHTRPGASPACPNRPEHRQKTCKTPLDTAPLLQG